MYYAQLRKLDVANGEGVRVSLFASGCTHNCHGCFNKDYQRFNYGKEMNFDVVDEIISIIGKKQYKGLTLIGGEPFQNLELIEYVKPIRAYIDAYNEKIKDKKFVKKDIWAYSGYSFEQLMSNEKRRELLELCDVLVDGLFVEELLNLKLKFRGSSNQRVIDIKKSIAEGKIVCYYGDPNI